MILSARSTTIVLALACAMTWYLVPTFALGLALVRLGRPAEALPLLDKAEALGFAVTQVAFRKACAQACLTFFNQGENRVRQLSEATVDGGKTWTVNYDLIYTRRATTSR